MADSDSFGQRLRAARVAAGLSQTALGEKVGATRQAVRTWELDLNQPQPGNIARIAQALEIDSSSLFPPPSASLTEAQRLDDVEEQMASMAAELAAMRSALEAHDITVGPIDEIPPTPEIDELVEQHERESPESEGGADDQRQTGQGS